MYPQPTQRAMLAFAGCSLVLVIGLLGVSATTVTLAGSGLLALAFAMLLTMPVADRLRRQRLELTWWHGHGQGALGSAAVVGTPFEVQCEVRNRGRHGLRLTELSPVLPQGAELVDGALGDVWLPAGTRTRFAFRVRVDAVGRAVLHGLSVGAPGPLQLFTAPLYFPSPLAVKVLPRAAHHQSRPMPPPGRSVERPGQTAVRRRGDGMELRELRELQPGDAFRSIAWRASARRGKLLVREMEREVQETLYVVLDVSGSMRGGALGERPLDQAIELAALAARDALERGDLLGLITVDGRIIDHALPAAGLPHMLRVYEAVLASTEVVDADLTEATDDEVAERVAKYLRQQDGLSFRNGEQLDMRGLLGHVRQSLRGDGQADSVVADDRDHALLRRYCQVRGIPLPYRADTRGFGKCRGLAQALRTAAGNTRMPRTILLLSDFDGIGDFEPLRRVLGLLQARAHRVIAICPEAYAAAESPPTDAQGAVAVALGLQEARRLAAVRARLSRLGVPLVVASRDARPPQIVAQVLGDRRVA